MAKRSRLIPPFLLATIEYADDAVAANKRKALIILGHIPSEQAGMEECARWLKGTTEAAARRREVSPSDSHVTKRTRIVSQSSQPLCAPKHY